MAISVHSRIAAITILIFLAASVHVCAQDVIPQIKSVSPEFGASDVDARTEISVSFNASMDKKSVEKNFHIFPEIKGRMRWQRNTLIFKPQKPLLPSTSYFVSFTPKIKAVDGVPLAVTYFSTPEKGVCVNPEGKIHIVSLDANSERVLVEGNNPVWATNNQSIIYDYDGKIWMMDTDGKGRVQLTGDEESYRGSHPVVNSVADLIAFVGTNAAGCDNVYTVEAETKIIRQLTGFFEPEPIQYLKWSPDGLYLAFLRSGQIWVMNREGRDMKKLTTDDLVCKANFAWSPGGTKIAFTGDANVWIGSIYSSEMRKISFDNPRTGMLDWSTNNKIVFEADGLTILDADGSNEIQVVTAGQKPVWINRGRLISFVLPLYKDDNTAQLWIMSADGLTKKKIAVINANQPKVSWSKNTGVLNLFSS